MRPNFTADETRGHLLALARACLLRLDLDTDWGTGLIMDGKRPFGNSGHGAILDTLEKAGIPFDATTDDDPDDEAWYDYARELWQRLPDFLSQEVELSLKSRERLTDTI